MEMERRGRFTIGTVARRTGLSPDVLRAWERRYGVVEPTRTGGGDRLYSTADLTRLQLLSRAVAAGHPIGRVAALPVEELAALVGEEEGARPARASYADGEDFVEASVAAVTAMDAARLHETLTRAVVSLGVAEFGEVVVEVLRRVGDGWEDGALCPAHEHLLSATVQRVLGWLLATIPVGAGAPGIVLSTPVNQRHELAALLAAVEAATEGWRVTYLGPDLRASDIARGASATGARAVGLSVVRETREHELRPEIEALRAELGADVALLVGGAGAQPHRELLASLGAVCLGDFVTFRSTLRTLAAAGAA